MAFRLKAKEPVGDGIKRIARRQIKKSLKLLAGKQTRRKHGASAEQSVSKQVRKHFKRVRAALRLVRDELGEDVFRDENWSFRDAGRLLSEVRDAEMVVETFELLEAERFPATVGPEALVTIHKALLANRKEVTRRILGDRGAFAAVEASATRALARLENWTIERDDWTAVEAGLGRVYRKGRRAIALARETPSVEHLHEWRKEVKYLRHQLQLLEASLTSSGQKMAKQVRELSRVLGDDRDLAVLRETLAADPLTYGGHRVLKGVFAIIDRRRKEIERHADALGRTVHEDPPIVFMKRMEAAYADLHADEPAAT